MRLVRCPQCGSQELNEDGGYATCLFCRSRFVLEAQDHPVPEVSIALSDDIQNLLDKCRSDPANRHRYASLVLDLDPSNSEALTYLN